METTDCTVNVLIGDALNQLKTLPDRSIQCCVTSPPYYGLRDYGTATWEGGDVGCDHKGVRRQSGEGLNARTGNAVGQAKHRDDKMLLLGPTCSKCGAVRIDRQIGLEETPAEYITKLVAVFGEVRRVLTDDGCCWVNLGDSYASGGNGVGSGKQLTNVGSHLPAKKAPLGFKPKDLIGVPWMFAFAARDDGWYLRQDIIWRKPNPMPESVTDRCVKSHEYLFLLTKSSRYYFDHKAIKEPATYAGKGRGGSKQRYEQNAAGMDNKQYDLRNRRSVWGEDDHLQLLNWLAANDPDVLAKFAEETMTTMPSVWDVTPKPFKGAHFAVFPPQLILPCVRAGSRFGDTVLDPFAGTGTTAEVALQEGRNAVLIELNPEYGKLIEKRLQSVQEDVQCPPSPTPTTPLTGSGGAASG